MRGLSLVAVSGSHSSSRCAGLSLSRPLLLWSTVSRRAGSVVVAHGPSCSAACGIFPDQGLNPCPLHWQADSQPLRHQGGPTCRSSLHILATSFLSETWIANIFLPVSDLSIHILLVFSWAEILNFDEVQYIILFILWLAFCMLSKKSLPTL